MASHILFHLRFIGVFVFSQLQILTPCSGQQQDGEASKGSTSKVIEWTMLLKSGRVDVFKELGLEKEISRKISNAYEEELEMYEEECEELHNSGSGAADKYKKLAQYRLAFHSRVTARVESILGDGATRKFLQLSNALRANERPGLLGYLESIDFFESEDREKLVLAEAQKLQNEFEEEVLELRKRFREKALSRWLKVSELNDRLGNLSSVGQFLFNF